MFLPAVNNSMEAFESLFKATDTDTLIVPTGAPPVADKILAAMTLQRLVLPELHDLLDDAPVEAIPFTGTFDQYRTKPWIILHTSGSTGIPKPIILRHGYPTTIDAGK